jgi:hypothetical protein
LALPITIIDLNAKLFQPFFALAQPEGASGSEAMILRFGGINDILTPINQLITRGQAVPMITTLLLVLSWTMAPLSAEAIGFKMHGTCTHLSITGCSASLGVSPQPTRFLIAVMGAMITLLIVLVAILRGISTGVYSNPWNMASIASLTSNYRLRKSLADLGEPTEAELDTIFRDGRFRLQIYSTLHDVHKDGGDDFQDLRSYEYGIVPLSDSSWSNNGHDERTLESNAITKLEMSKPSRRHVPFFPLTYTWRIIFILFLLGLMVMIIYYHLLQEDNAFELFMDSQAFGVKFFFAALGGLINFFWASFFMSAATVTPFLLLQTRPRSAAESIQLTRPTNAFYGAYAAARQGNLFLLAAAVTAILAELLPILLSNIPYTLTQTLRTHEVCSFLSIAILSIMVLVLVSSIICVRWPHMPVDPRTLAGAAYYVADSRALMRDVAGSSMPPDDHYYQKEASTSDETRQYFYGTLVGSSGRTRMVIDRF